MHAHKPRHGVSLPVAVLAAGAGLRIAVLLPLVLALWAAIGWALMAE